jgi:antitoxin VapB
MVDSRGYLGGVALNIKNRETEELAHQLADATGESLTGAVTAALRERLARVKGGDQAEIAGRVERLRALSKDAAGRWVEPYRSADHGDLLYDEAGLPR